MVVVLPFGQVVKGLGGGIIAIITGFAMLAPRMGPDRWGTIGAVSIALIGFLGARWTVFLGHV